MIDFESFVGEVEKRAETDPLFNAVAWSFYHLIVLIEAEGYTIETETNEPCSEDRCGMRLVRQQTAPQQLALPLE